jgi:hypothetical protein
MNKNKEKRENEESRKINLGIKLLPHNEQDKVTIIF